MRQLWQRIANQSDRLLQALLFGALVFAGHLLVMLTIALLAPGVRRGWLEMLVEGLIVSLLVVALVMPLLLRLSRRAQYAEKAIDSTSDGYWVIDVEGRFVEVNPGYCRMLGYRHDEVMAMCIADFEAVATMPKIQAQIRRIMAKGYERFETRHRHRDGHWIDLEITVSGVDQRYLVAFLRDISARKAADDALRQAMQAAEAANRAKSQFLANVSHEIRTPLNGVLGLTHLVLATELNVEQREHLELARSSANALLAILNDILDFSKVEAGMLRIEQVGFDLRQVVTEAVQAIGVRAEAKGLALHRQLNELPEHVLGDPGRLRQVLLNLCDNAIKFTAKGSVTVAVSASPQADGKACEVRFAVCDTGIGIAASKREAIFQAFQQADASTTRKFGGTGLGLAISARLVALMGGRLWVESEEGAGSSFQFTVRLGLLAGAVPLPPAITALAAAPALADAAQAQRRLNVLVAEDYPINQKVLMGMLQRWGHSVTLASNGQEAVEQFSRGQWDVVLMDVQMPELDGIEATLRIRALEQGRSQRVPIIAVTASALETDRQACLQAGMDDHLSKPVNPAQLQAVLERLGCC